MVTLRPRRIGRESLIISLRAFLPCNRVSRSVLWRSRAPTRHSLGYLAPNDNILAYQAYQVGDASLAEVIDLSTSSRIPYEGADLAAFPQTVALAREYNYSLDRRRIATKRADANYEFRKPYGKRSSDEVDLQYPQHSFRDCKNQSPLEWVFFSAAGYRILFSISRHS